MAKKKVFIHTDFSLAKTGFGRNARALLTYLYKTGKYEIVNYCCGMAVNSPQLRATPWKSIGSVPSNQREVEQYQKDPNQARLLGYGDVYLDKTIAEEKPDIYIGVQDPWGFNIEKKWWNKIPCVLWVTLDSLPILPSVIQNMPKTKNLWVWSNFAEKELHRLGYRNVKTINGALEDKAFYRLPDEKRSELRKRFNIPDNAFIITFCFRNQLRKSVPNIIEGYSLFKKSNLNLTNSYLYFHTSWTEGWDIKRLLDEFKISSSEILTTYICHACNEYQVKNYTGEQQDCPYCGIKKSQFTCNVGRGVTEEQLNEIYNLASVYLHAFTSGGQEIPVIEAKLTELITLVTNYSCGEELCEEGSCSFSLDWASYREPGTQFIKSSTYPSSIAKQLSKIYAMEPKKKRELEKQSRAWALGKYSVEIIGKKIEEFLDSCPVIEEGNKEQIFSQKEPLKNPEAKIPKDLNNRDFIIQLYKEILLMEVDENESGARYWLGELEKGASRDQIENYFRQVASKHNAEQGDQNKFENLLNPDDKKRVLVVLPESIGDIYLATALFESLRKRYSKPEWAIYFATQPQYFEMLDGNSYIDNVIPFLPDMDNIFAYEGIGGHKGLFDVVYPLHFGTQRLINYVHNSCDSSHLELT